MSHLTPDLIQRYRAGALCAPELLALDDHVVECASCRDRLAASSRGAAGRVADQIRFAAAAEGEHLTYDQVAALAEGRDIGAAAHHVTECSSCQADVADLRAFRAELASSRPAAMPARTTRMGWSVGAAAAAVIIITSLGLLLRRTPNAVEQAQDRLALHDAGVTLRVDEKGQVRGVPESFAPAEQALIAGVLRDRHLPGPAESTVEARTGTLMGGTDASASFRVKEPNGAVLDARPLFSWTPWRPNAEYRVRIFDVSFQELQSSPWVRGTEWRASAPLPRGANLAWQVEARLGGGHAQAPVPPEPEAHFRIVDESTASAISGAARAQHPSQLLLAALYTRAGLYADAERALAALAVENPGSATVKQLQTQLSEMRKLSERRP